MMIKEIYREEKNKDVYTDVDNGEQGSYTNDYVKWLENLAEKQCNLHFVRDKINNSGES